jgi:RecA-family ATPase
VKLEFSAHPESLDDLGADWADLPEEEIPEPKIRQIEDLPRVEDIGSAEIAWDVEGLVPRATVVLFTGVAGAGKSTFVSALAYAVSKGQPFLGMKTSKRPVLIIDAENPSVAVIDRFQRLGIKTDDDFRVWGQWTGEDPPPAGGAIVVEWITRSEPKPLIIIDSFIRFHPGAENDSTETQKYMAPYRKLATLGATIVILHHIGRDTSQDYRGSSDIKASVDIAYKVVHLGDEALLSRLEIRAFKQRIKRDAATVRQVRGRILQDRRAACGPKCYGGPHRTPQSQSWHCWSRVREVGRCPQAWPEPG